jgi:1-deoxy-D-xylulose-5-phosphate reductoisomerase
VEKKELIQAASDNNDIVMSSLVGFSGVFPTLAAIRAGSTIALANKETLVSAGEIIMKEAHIHNTSLLAVDSEHSAILQSIVGENIEDIEKIILTASGGPFRTMDKNLFSSIKPEDALKHPNWTMGAKITIDSATLMNKGFEVIEAHWLFSMPAEKIDVIIHPQSIIHSMVQFNDGSIKAQLGTPDMRIPIAYALYYPRHAQFDFPRLDFTKLKDLTFEQPDTDTFPCLRFAYDCMKTGRHSTCNPQCCQ